MLNIVLLFTSENRLCSFTLAFLHCCCLQIKTRHYKYLAHFCYLQKHHHPDHTSSVCFSHFDIIVVTMLITVLSARLDIY